MESDSDSHPSSSKIVYDHDHGNDNVNDSGAPRARSGRERSPIAKKIWYSIHPRNFCNHVTVGTPASPPVHPHDRKPMRNVKLSS